MIARILTGALKDNDYVEKTIITGVYDTLKKNSASGLNNVYMDIITKKNFD